MASSNPNKIAFCFLTYGDVTHRAIWGRFFADADPSMFTVVIHSSEGIRSTWIPNATIIPTQPTEWGKFSLVEAQQSLFEAALRDDAVAKCILVSGDTLPLYSFAHIYSRVMADTKGWMHYKLDRSSSNHVNWAAWNPVQKQMNPNMQKQMSQPQWSNTSQWVILTRSHILALRENFVMLRNTFGASHIPDEHAYSVFFYSHSLLDSFHLQKPMYYMMETQFVRTRFRVILPIAKIPITCTLTHRKKPLTFHSEDFTSKRLKSIYGTGCLFMRKICCDTRIKVDWSKHEILV